MIVLIMLRLIVIPMLREVHKKLHYFYKVKNFVFFFLLKKFKGKFEIKKDRGIYCTIDSVKEFATNIIEKILC